MFPIIQATLQLVSARIYYFVVSTRERPASTKYSILRCPEQQKTTKPSSSAMEKVQEESSTYEESSSSDQEQDSEAFFQPCQAHVIPNMFMHYTEGPKMDWRVNDGLCS